jgi:hypothetical protein
MNLKYKLIVPLALGALLAAGCNKVASNSAQNNSNNEQASSAAQNTGSLKFTDQSYYNNAYLISGATLSADAQKALTGFSMSKQTLTNGDTQITLTALKAEYRNQQYTLHSGDQLYFIDKFVSDDDSEANEDKNKMDDSAVVVDSQGNVVGQPAGFTPSATSTPASAATSPQPTSQKPATPTPAPASKSFTVNASDEKADLTTITVAKGTPVSITFKADAQETYHGGLDFRSPNLSTGTIAPGASKTVSFTAANSFTFIPYWPSTNIQKPYTISIVVQ